MADLCWQVCYEVYRDEMKGVSFVDVRLLQFHYSIDPWTQVAVQVNVIKTLRLHKCSHFYIPSMGK